MEALFLSVAKLFSLIALGFICYRLNFLPRNTLKVFSFALINIAIPSLIFSNIVNSFDPEGYFLPLLFFVLSIAFFALGLILALCFSARLKKKVKKEFLSLVSFQNCGYLPMNLALFLFSSGAQREQFLNYVFLYLLGFNLLIWSIASYLIFKEKGDSFNYRSLFTPPVISVIAALIFVYSNKVDLLPGVFIDTLSLVGKVAFFLSMFVLGGWLAASRIKVRSQLLVLLRANFIKLILLPLITIFIVVNFKIYSLLGLFLVIQASMPAAASLPIVADLRGGNREFISRGVFLSHVLSIITIPFWIKLFLTFSNFSL
jgi:hypothetical protein